MSSPSPGPCYLLPPGPPNTLALVCALHLTAPWARLGRAKDAGQRSLLGAQRQGDPGCVTFWAFVPSWRMARLSCIRSQHFLDGSPQLARNLSLSHARRPSRPPPREPAPQLAPRPPPSAGFLSRPERGEEPPPRRLRLVLPSSQACPKLRGQATPGPTRDLTPLSDQRLVCLSSYKYFHQTFQAPPCVKPRLGQRTRGLKPLDTGGHSPCHGPRGQRLKADRPLTAGARAGCVALAQGPGRHGD